MSSKNTLLKENMATEFVEQEQTSAGENYDNEGDEIDSSSYSGSSSRSRTGSNIDMDMANNDDDLREVQALALKEDRRVFYSRALVAFAILAVGGLVSSLTYVVLHAQVQTSSSDAVSLSVHTRSENRRKGSRDRQLDCPHTQ
ncbi:MAG: hypothetical protein JRN15_08680 [Nitrososphaerota archaeon]|nr:hypothetical protein [Nitrososphaerota archaeon]